MTQPPAPPAYPPPAYPPPAYPPPGYAPPGGAYPPPPPGQYPPPHGYAAPPTPKSKMKPAVLVGIVAGVIGLLGLIGVLATRGGDDGGGGGQDLVDDVVVVDPTPEPLPSVSAPPETDPEPTTPTQPTADPDSGNEDDGGGGGGGTAAAGAVDIGGGIGVALPSGWEVVNGPADNSVAIGTQGALAYVTAFSGAGNSSADVLIGEYAQGALSQEVEALELTDPEPVNVSGSVVSAAKIFYRGWLPSQQGSTGIEGAVFVFVRQDGTGLLFDFTNGQGATEQFSGDFVDILNGTLQSF